MNSQTEKYPKLRLVYSVSETERAKVLVECPLCGEMELLEYLKKHRVCSRCENKNAA